MRFPAEKWLFLQKMHFPTEKCAFLQTKKGTFLQKNAFPCRKMHFPAEKCGFFWGAHGRKPQEIAGGFRAHASQDTYVSSRSGAGGALPSPCGHWLLLFVAASAKEIMPSLWTATAAHQSSELERRKPTPLGRHVCRTKLPLKNFEFDTKHGLKSEKKDLKNDLKHLQIEIEPLSCRLKISHRYFSKSCSPPKTCTIKSPRNRKEQRQRSGNAKGSRNPWVIKFHGRLGCCFVTL